MLIGNPLAHFLANMFMGRLKLQAQGISSEFGQCMWMISLLFWISNVKELDECLNNTFL